MQYSDNPVYKPAKMPINPTMILLPASLPSPAAKTLPYLCVYGREEGGGGRRRKKKKDESIRPGTALVSTQKPDAGKGTSGDCRCFRELVSEC